MLNVAKTRTSAASVKRKLIISVLVAVALLVCGALYVTLPLWTIRRLHTRYKEAQRGMPVEQVETLMACRGQWLPAPPQFAAWDDAALPPDQTQRISSVLRYTVRIIPVPVSFEFTFDDQRRLVGKHIYD
jgi:hypothetical protein